MHIVGTLPLRCIVFRIKFSFLFPIFIGLETGIIESGMFNEKERRKIDCVSHFYCSKIHLFYSLSIRNYWWHDTVDEKNPSGIVHIRIHISISSLAHSLSDSAETLSHNGKHEDFISAKKRRQKVRDLRQFRRIGPRP